MSHLTPVTKNLVVKSTGYLTPEDLKNFDKSVHQYINGFFYRFDERGADVINDFLVRRMMLFCSFF
jgi:hypothetical protein